MIGLIVYNINSNDDDVNISNYNINKLKYIQYRTNQRYSHKNQCDN